LTEINARCTVNKTVKKKPDTLSSPTKVHYNSNDILVRFVSVGSPANAVYDSHNETGLAKRRH
jgi:hypothetical protein